MPQFPLYLRDAEVLSHQASPSFAYKTTTTQFTSNGERRSFTLKNAEHRRVSCSVSTLSVENPVETNIAYYLAYPKINTIFYILVPIRVYISEDTLPNLTTLSNTGGERTPLLSSITELTMRNCLHSLQGGACFSKFLKLCGLISGATISFISSQRRGSKPSSFTIFFLFFFF